MVRGTVHHWGAAQRLLFVQHMTPPEVATPPPGLTQVSRWGGGVDVCVCVCGGRGGGGWCTPECVLGDL